MEYMHYCKRIHVAISIDAYIYIYKWIVNTGCNIATVDKYWKEVHTDARVALEINVSIVGGICRHLSTCCSKEISAF